MKLNQEILNHFSCDHCKYWWSIASAKFELGQKVYCPWCSHQNTISEIDAQNNVDFQESPPLFDVFDGRY